MTGLRIRRAGVVDLPAVFALCQAMHTEAVTPFPAPDEAVLRRTLELAAAQPLSVLLSIAEVDDKAAGLVTGFAGGYAWSDEKRAVGDLLFLSIDSRGFARARALVHHFIVWSRHVGAARALIGGTTGINPVAFVQFLERLGFTHDGAGLCRLELR